MPIRPGKKILYVEMPEEFYARLTACVEAEQRSLKTVVMRTLEQYVQACEAAQSNSEESPVRSRRKRKENS
jgi:hypothetical protein